MEQTYPRFTPDMKKTHKILIPNMAPVQFRILAASMENHGYQVELLGNCGERAVYGLKQRLWIFLEQPGNRNSSFWCKQDRVVRKEHKKTGLLYYGRRYTV